MKSKSGTKAIAAALGLTAEVVDVELTGVSLSAAEVEPGDLFIAIQGQRHHGLDFLAQAISNGAAAILSDRDVDSEIPVLVHPNPKSISGLVCELIFPELKLKMFGVTGTNGKTSVSSYLHQIISDLGANCALSTSVGFEGLGSLKAAALTTPELTTLRKWLRDFATEGGEAVAIEVSAQALTRNRVDGLKFEVVGFTNLTRDHLDDYGSMDNYFRAKAQLFTKERAQQGVVFLSDNYAKKLAAEATIPITTVGDSADVEFAYKAGVLTLSGRVNFEIEFSAGELMARNFALALVMAHCAGFDIQKLSSLPANYQVPGRLELVSKAEPHVYVDYAHTPDGIAKAVEEIRSRYSGVTLVFGASGNRDVGKRVEMGRAAAAADRVYLTDQHPRDENPADIRAAVAEGLLDLGKNFVEVPDPAEAIAVAIASTPRDQAVLWCGPGHLKYREIAGQKIAFDARKMAKNLVEK